TLPWCALSRAVSVGWQDPTLSHAEPTESVPDRRDCARHQHLQIPLALKLAVDGDARQRGQIVAVDLEQHARPRRQRGLEAEFGRNAEFARAGWRHVADGEGEGLRASSERRLQHGTAHFYLSTHGRIARHLF